MIALEASHTEIALLLINCDRVDLNHENWRESTAFESAVLRLFWRLWAHLSSILNCIVLIWPWIWPLRRGNMSLQGFCLDFPGSMLM
jgi:hypothetical protein